MMDAETRLKETLFKVESVFFLLYSQLYADAAKAGSEEERMKQIKTVETVNAFHTEVMKYSVNAAMILINEAELMRRDGLDVDESAPLPHPFEELEGKNEAEILGWLKEKMQSALAAASLEKARALKEDD
jgi:hypothetical protein